MNGWRPALVIAGVLCGPAPAFQQPGGAPAQGPVDQGEVARAVDEYLSVSGREPSTLERTLERMVFYGDFRFRGESTFLSNGQTDRHRLRVRGRLGVNYRALDEVVVGARLVTGDPEDPRSPHWTLGNEFEGLDVTLDRLFVQWLPAAVQGGTLVAGKFDRTVQRNPVYGELLWDADVQPEGLEGVYERSLEGALQRAGLALAGYVYEERAAASDATIFSAQAWARVRAGAQGSVGASVEYATYDGLATANVSPGAGLDYDLLHPLVDAQIEVAGAPLRLGVESFHNLAESGGDSRGWAAGIALGSLARAGDWIAYYQYQDIGRAAVFAPLAQDDFTESAGFSGHLVGANHKLTDAIGLNLWTLISTRDDSVAPERTSYRVRLDLNIKL